MNLRERFEWLLQIALLVFILAAAGFLSAITAIRFAIHGRIVQVPSLVGQDSKTAQKMLADRGLGMSIADRIYTDAPADRVVRQVPPAGEQVKIGQQAHVVISLGARRVSIPLIEGRSLRAARVELLRGNLQVGEISGAYLPDTEPEMVVVQDPQPGTTVASPHVNLLVSQGTRDPAFVMPVLLGQSPSDAQRSLALAGLRSVKLVFVPDPLGSHGTILSQSPPSGTRVTKNHSIELQISE
jgi:beta-lactam-binding protein with PASTA domain